MSLCSANNVYQQCLLLMEMMHLIFSHHQVRCWVNAFNNLKAGTLHAKVVSCYCKSSYCQLGQQCCMFSKHHTNITAFVFISVKS